MKKIELIRIYLFLTVPIFSLIYNQVALGDEDKKVLEILQISSDPEIKATVLVADKLARQIFVFRHGELSQNAEKYEIDIGKNDGDKTKRDDKKTPEGIYVLEKKMAPPEIPFEQYGSLAFTTNYPNVFDKFENKTGSGIWLHSVPDTVPLNRGSKGCVVVRNNIIQDLQKDISLNKSFLIINSTTHWLPAVEHEKKKKLVLDFFNQWRAQWEMQNLDDYIKNYSDEFSAPENMNKQRWLAHKQNLKSKYKYVKVSLGSPTIFNQKNQYIMKFIQNYESDAHKDRGIKTLYLIEKNNSLEILREEWTPLI